MYILGISCYYHDSAAVLIKDGMLIAASEEERFSRKKHDDSFPTQAVAFCLRKAGISPSDISYVVFYEKPFHKFERVLLSSFTHIPHSLNFFTASMKKWFFDYLWIKSHIARELMINPKQILFSEHHLSHAASAYYASPFDSAAVLSIDGVGEWSTVSWGIAKKSHIEMKEEIRYPHSLGLLYSVFTDFIGFEVNEGEYKVMGLAPYGTPKYVDKVEKLLQKYDDGSFQLESEYFAYPYSLKKTFTSKVIELFGQPNQKGNDEVIQYYADVAASIQQVLEEALVKIATYVRKRTGLSKLCYAGGVALNSKANWEIAKRAGFSDIYIQPAAGDSGGALGAAFWAYHAVLGHPRSFTLSHGYWGEKETEEQIVQTLKKSGVKYRHIPSEEKLLERVVDILTHQKVIGWVQDEAEWGPRALGHRSIIADPRSLQMKETVNRKIKFREGFRPFAPSVLAEKAPKYFSLEEKNEQSPLRFMLYVTPVKKNQQQHLAAITHVDGTARPQLVEKKQNPLYYSLIQSFGRETDVHAVLNTSFNLKGEPIVNTTTDALRTFSRSGLDALVVGQYIIEK